MSDETLAERRMKRIDMIYENCPYLCWAELVVWAMYRIPGEPINVYRANECRDDAAEFGTCYCGLYRCDNP